MAKGMEYQITNLLYERGITQKELAKATGITESAISHYIKGDRVPRGVNLIKIAKALGTTTDYLLNHEGCSNKQTEFESIKTLIARSASQMTETEKLELVSILVNR